MVLLMDCSLVYDEGSSRSYGCPNGVCKDTDMAGTDNVEAASISSSNGILTMVRSPLDAMRERL